MGRINIHGMACRPAVAEDAPRLRDLEKAAGREPDSFGKELAGVNEAHGAAEACFAPDGRMAAFGFVKPAGDPGPDSFLASGLTHPEFRGNGLGAYLLAWAERFAQDEARSAGQSEPVKLIARTERLSPAVEALYAKCGFDLVFAEDVMEKDLNSSAIERECTEDLELIGWTDESAAVFYDVYSSSFCDRPGFPGWTQQQWLNWLADEDFRPDLSCVALKNGLPVGFVVCHCEQNGPGWVTQAGVVPRYRRLGIGEMLIRTLLSRLQAEGFRKAVLDVNTNNPGARALYLKLGFAVEHRRAKYQKMIDL